MSKRFIVKVYTPKGLILEKSSEYLNVCGKSGDVGIFYGHTPSLLECISGMELKTSHNDHSYYLSDSIVHIEKEEITIMAKYIEAIENIDKKRAQLAKERAEKRIKEVSESVVDSEIDIKRANKALQRAVHRLDLLAKHQTL